MLVIFMIVLNSGGVLKIGIFFESLPEFHTFAYLSIANIFIHPLF